MSEIEKETWKWAKISEDTGEVVKFNQNYKTILEVKADNYEKEHKKVQKINTDLGLIVFSNTLDNRYVTNYIDTSRRNPFGKNAIYRGYIDILRDRLCRYTNAITQEVNANNKIPKVMTKQEIIDYLEVSKTQFYRFFKEAKDLGVLCEVTYDTGGEKRTAVLMNPAYSHQSVQLSWEVFRAFENDTTFNAILKDSHFKQYERVNTEIKYLK